MLAEIYTADYFLGDDSGASNQRVAALKTATSALYLDPLTKAGISSGTRLLEIGYSSGTLLLQAQSRSFEIWGIDYSTAAHAKANRRLGAEFVRTGTIENLSLQLGHFDLVVVCDVIEHTRNPRSFLERAHGLLRPAGLIFLVTPSLDSWSRKLLGQRWIEYKIEHLFQFGRRSLERLLIDTGFERPLFAGNRKALSLDYVYHDFERLPVVALTPLFRLVRRCVPERLAYRHYISGERDCCDRLQPCERQDRKS